MPNTTSEEVPPFKESRTQVAGLAKERETDRGRDTRMNYENKRNEDKKQGMNMKSPIKNTKESKPIKCERKRCSNDQYI